MAARLKNVTKEESARVAEVAEVAVDVKIKKESMFEADPGIVEINVVKNEEEQRGSWHCRCSKIGCHH